MNLKKMGKLIAEIRKEKGMTQEELGNKLNVNSKAVSKWECGISSPDISIINDLANILEIETSDLLKGVKTSNNLKTKKDSKKIMIIKIFIVIISILLIITITKFIVEQQYKEIKLSTKDSEISLSAAIIPSPRTKTFILYSLKYQDEKTGTSNEIYAKSVRVYILNDKEEYLFFNTFEEEDENGNLIKYPLSYMLKQLSPQINELTNKEKINTQNIKLKIIYENINNEEITKTYNINVS